MYMYFSLCFRMKLKGGDSNSPRMNFTAGLGNNNQQFECLLSSTNRNVEERCIPIAGGQLNVTVYGRHILSTV